MTEYFDIGDVIRATMGNPLDAIVKAADEPAIEKQVRAPTSNEIAEIEKLASDAAQLQDEIKAALGTKSADLKKLKEQLKARLIEHGLKEVVIAGRPPIELTESKKRQVTRKAIVGVFQAIMVKQLGDKKKGEAEGKMKGLNLWNKLPFGSSQGISIPQPTPPEMDAPY